MMKRPLMMLTLALNLIATAGCSFTPLYGESYTGDGPIFISQIDGRIGHRLRQELSRTLSTGLPSVEDGAHLDVTVNEAFRRLALKLDAGVSRTTVVAEARYTLTGADGNVIANGFVISQADYDSADTSYGDITLQNDARERAALSLARRIRDELVLDVSEKQTPATASSSDDTGT